MRFIAGECQGGRMLFVARLDSREGFINPSFDLGCIAVSSGSRDVVNAPTIPIRWH